MSDTPQSPTILIVGHDRKASSCKAALLTRHGYQVFEADTGAKALQLAATAPPAVIVITSGLPHFGDGEMCRRFKSEPTTQHSMVLEISGSGGQTAADDIQPDRRADGFLIEPVEEAELLASVRALIRLAKRESENRRLAEKLGHTERQFLEITEAAQCGVWDWDIGRDVLQWFGAYERLAGVPLGACGGPIQAFIDSLHPDDRPGVRRRLHEIMESRRTDYADEYRFVHSNGTVRWMQATGRLYYNDEGIAVRMTGVLQDITERKLAETAVALTKNPFEATLAASDIGLWHWELSNDWLITDLNLKRLFAIETAGEVSLETYLRRIHPEDAARNQEAIERAIHQGAGYDAEFRVVWPDGTVRWIHSRGKTERDSDGRARTFSGVVLDVTERKRADEALRQGDERRALLLEVSRLILESRDAGEDLTRSVFEKIHRHVHADICINYRLASDGGSLELVAAIGVADHVRRGIERLQMGQAFCGTVAATCAPVMADAACIDGDERGILVRGIGVRAYACHPLLAHNGGVIGTLSFGSTKRTSFTPEDIAFLQTICHFVAIAWERHAGAVSLRESEARYRATFESAAIGIAHVGLDGRWLRFNDAICRITGYSREELSGRTFSDITHPEDVEKDWTQARRVLAGEIDTYSMEKRYVRKDGTFMWVNLTVSLLRDARDRPLHFISVIEDIDERKQAEQALREAQERLQQWNVELEQAVSAKTAELYQSQERLRALAAELNRAEQRERKRLALELHDHLQQLLVLGKLKLGQTKLLAEGLPDCASRIKEADEVLTDALTYTRTLVAELSPPVLRDHGLAAGLKWLADFMRKHDLVVTVVVPEGTDVKLPEEQAVLLFQSVRELLINVSRHAGTNQALVTLERRDAVLRIEVMDSGVGLHEAPAVGSAKAGETSSSKFGLFSIRERMKALGGSFDIHSVPGCGTTARLTLPISGPLVAGQIVNSVAKEDRSVITPAPLNAHGAHPSDMDIVRVLLVDDHAMVRQGLRTVLDAYPDIVVAGEATNGSEALALADELRPSVVLMDINMPVLNGIEATAELTALHPEMVVIGLSVNAGEEHQAAMKRAGAAMLITKEAAVDRLYDAIHQAVRQGSR